MRSLLLCIFLAGCAAGATNIGQRWVKEGATGNERSAAIDRCLDQSGAQAVAVVPPSELSKSLAARKYFARACMEAAGWRLEPPSPPLAAPTPPPRWHKDGSTQQDYDVATARCRMQIAMLPESPTPTNGATLGGAIQNAGQVMQTGADRQQFANDCMVAQGWTLR